MKPLARRRGGFIYASIIIATVCFYAWTVRTTTTEFARVGGEQGDYYNLLVHGLMDGHLSLKAEVPAALISSENPYDPAKRPPGVGMHDVSYYRGKYYLYFGLTPVATLYLPFRLLVGADLPMSYGNIIFVSLGFMMAAWTWLNLRRRYFPRSNVLIGALGLLGLGCCGMTFSLLRRPSLWELPISAGYAMAMCAVALFYRGLHSARAAHGWYVASGVCLGMAVGARPVYIVGGVFVLAFIATKAWSQRRPGEWLPARDWWRESFALGGAFSAVIAGLLLYNYLRFGSFTEFGLNYQLTGAVESKVRHFHWTYMPFNAYIYYLAPAQWSHYFPFIQFIHPPKQPDGYYGIEYPYGVLTNMPLTLFAVLAPLGLVARTGADHRRLSQFILCVGALFFALAIFLSGFVTGAQRYMADFTPTLILLSVIGVLGVERWSAWRRGWVRRFVLASAICVGLFSVFFGLMTSFQLHGLYRTMSPGSFEKVSYLFNYPLHLWDRLRGVKYGPLEMEVKFPQALPGELQPLISTGWEFYSDHLFIQYIDEKHIRFGFDHTSRGTRWSPPIEVDMNAVHRIRAEMGSLYPPKEHPYFGQLSDVERTSVTRLLRVIFDGETVIESPQEFYESSPDVLRIGGTSYTQAYGRKFTGKVLSLERGQYHVVSEMRGVPGPVVLQLLFPRLESSCEPLVATGKSGRADTLYVRYLPDDFVQFGYDHWGEPAIESAPVHIEHDHIHKVTICMPSLLRSVHGTSYSSAGATLTVYMNDRLVWGTPVPFYPSPATQIAIARNTPGSSVCQNEYTGLLAAIGRDPEVVEPTVRRSNFVRLKVLFPSWSPGKREPLFTRGVQGAADLLVVQYVDSAHVRFAVDHWGKSLYDSEVLGIEYDKPHEVLVKFINADGSACPAERPPQKLLLEVDGRTAWQQEGPFYPADPDTVTVGLNRIGASTCVEAFSGVLQGIHFTETDS